VLLLTASFFPHSHGTGQIRDIVYFDGQKYDLIEWKGDLPSPENYGMTTEPSSTADARGYDSEYVIAEDRLLLRKMRVTASHGKYTPIDHVAPDLETLKSCRDRKPAPPDLWGQSPEESSPRNGKKFCFSYGAIYKLNIYPSYTGMLRIARDFLQSRFNDMPSEPSSYRVVFDITFDSGVVTKAVDRTIDVEQVRRNWSKSSELRESGGKASNANPVELPPLQ
jgi:hypothetical protein